jgi:hypothetical protein
MHARLQNGPGDTQEFQKYPDPPPPTALFFAGGKVFPAKVFRYQLIDVDRNLPDPRATYDHPVAVTS